MLIKNIFYIRFTHLLCCYDEEESRGSGESKRDEIGIVLESVIQEFFLLYSLIE